MATQERHWILCGGLASGKSLVREMLAGAGVATIDADSVGHEVLLPDGGAFREVVARWPTVNQAGVIDRSRLAEIVFRDSEELAALEAITHPHIFGLIESLVEEMVGSVVVEIPLLEHGLGPGWRRMVVDCDEGVRLERAVGRGMTREDALARMEIQPTRCEWLAAADLVIPNNGSFHELATSVESLLTVLSP